MRVLAIISFFPPPSEAALSPVGAELTNKGAIMRKKEKIGRFVAFFLLHPIELGP